MLFEKFVPAAKPAKPANPAPNFSNFSNFSREPNSDRESLSTNASEGGPVVFDYWLEGNPRPLVMLSQPGTTLERARWRLQHQYGDRVTAVQFHSTQGKS